MWFFRALRPVLIIGLIASFGVAGSWAQRIEPDRIHWVSLGDFADLDSATSRKSDLSEAGYAPVHVVQQGDEFEVRVGEFAVLADAWLLWEDLRVHWPAAQLADASLADERAAGREWPFTPLTAPPSPREIFNLSESPLESDTPLRFLNEEAAIADGGQLVTAVAREITDPVESEALALVDVAKDPADSARGLAYFVLADIRAGRGDLSEALDLAMEVATHNLAAASQKRYEAMWLVARIHHAMRNRMTAYRAYRELQPFINDDRDLARCLVEQQGLLVELQRHHATGRLEDGRLRGKEMLDLFGESTDPDIRHRCATAALMISHSYQRVDRELAITTALSVADNYSEFRRETVGALYYAGNLSNSVGRVDDAIALFELVIEIDLQPEENFPNVDQTQRALQSLARIWQRRGDDQRAEECRQRARERGIPHSEQHIRWRQRWQDQPTDEPPR